LNVDLRAADYADDAEDEQQLPRPCVCVIGVIRGP